MNKLGVICAALLFSGAPTAAHNSDTDCEPSKQKDGQCQHAKAERAPKTNAKRWNGGVLIRGNKITGAPTVTLAELLKSPETRDGKELIVEGTVRRACERRGCWMELAESKTGPGVRVTFKDYGFFVPIDSAGARAKVAGRVTVTELSQDLAAHYESEGATITRDSTGKPRDIQLVADGVELRR